MQHIFSLAEQHDVDRIQLNSHNLAPQNLGPERREIPFWVEEYGAELGLAFTSYGMSPAPGMASCNSDQIVSLELDEQALFMQLEEACRRAVRKADSSGLSFREATHVDCIADYYRIAQLSARRTGEHLPPESYYSDIWNKFADDGRCAVFLVEYESKTVAALFLLVDKAACSYLGGVSDPDYLPLRVNDFAHWRAMLWAKKRGLRHYRLGPWFPSVSEEWAIAKVSRFKKRFGGRSMTIIQGSIFRHPERYLDQAKVLLEELCRKR